MIKSFKSKSLKELHETGKTSRIDHRLHKRIIRRLDAMEAAESMKALNLPGFDFHPLKTDPVRYSIHVNGPWCITFEWDARNASRVDFEQYH